MNKKRNSYIALSILSIAFIVIIEGIFNTGSLSGREPDFTINLAKLKEMPLFLGFTALSLGYAAVFILGLINLWKFTLTKIKNKLLTPLDESWRRFKLNETESAKLFFLTSLLLLFIYFLSLASGLWGFGRSINFALVLNLLLQIGTTLLVLKYIGTEYLNFSLNKKDFNLLFKTYTMIVPLTLMALLLNSLLLEKLGIKSYPGPAVELLFILDNKLSLAILTIQIILIGPLAEELFFRGFIYRLVREKYSFLVSAALSSLFFSAIHNTLAHILPIFIISLGLCYVYEKTKKILPCIILHALHNLVSFSFFLTLKNLI